MKRKTFEDVWEFVKKGNPDDCWEWQGYKARGYGSMMVSRVAYYAHRLVYGLTYPNSITFKAPKDKSLKQFIMHKCDNPACCNPNHMELGSQEDNNKDAKNKGRARGLKNEKHNLSVLSNEQVAQIRLFHGHGWSQKEMSDMFGVSPSVMNRVVRYKTYIGV
jgi:hypothetical protein